ncbi:hypothetical protein Tco_0931131 [Tanacetum coccineum]
MSTAEAEYVSLSACCAQDIWMRTELLDYGYKYNRISMYYDSKSAIAISCNPVQHSKTKHIDIRYHFIKEHVEKGTVELYFVGTEYQLADLFTKALPKERFEYLVHRIVIIMAQQQHAADVHLDELCPPNKRYDLMDANKKVDLGMSMALESKILTNIIKNHPLRFNIAASSSIPWIYMAQKTQRQSWKAAPDGMITDRNGRHTEHYQMYAEVFGIDVPLTQSQPTESTQGTHRTPSAPRSPNPDKEVAESSALRRITVIRLILTSCLTEHKKSEEQEDRAQGRNKESPEVEITKDKEVEITKDKEVEITKETTVVDITNVVIIMEASFLKQVWNHVPAYVAQGLILERQKAKEETERLIAKAILQECGNIQAQISTQIENAIANDDPHDDAHPEGGNSAKRQKTSEYKAYVSGESSYGINDDEIPMKQVSQDIMEEVSLTIDEAKLRKMADEMLRQRCTLGDEHHCQKDPEAPALSLINQDLLYLKKGNSGLRRRCLATSHVLAVIFNYDDIEDELPVGKQKEPGKPKEEVYSNSKIIQVVKTYWELGHEHKFITEIVVRRANKYLMSITKPDYKNLNKNDIEDIYLLIMNGKVPDYADKGLLCYQKKVNLMHAHNDSQSIEDHEMFSIIYEPVHGIIYKNNKKEKWVMRHSKIHKFCDATLNRVLEGLKSYNNDINYGYVQKDLTKDEAKYLKLFEKEIE